MTTAPDNETVSLSQVIGGQGRLSFGRYLQGYRVQQDMPQSEAATLLGISVAMLSKYENGHKLPSLKLAFAMAQTLGLEATIALDLLINDQIRRDDLPFKAELKSVS
jgi:transcriptional regulator with XRE-family HTH domain